MSTRATYQFKDKTHNTKTTVYIHYDGYLEGAAYYLYETLTKPSKGGMATQFIRANPQAEITTAHEQHADADYCYDIEGCGPDADICAYHYEEKDGQRKRVCLFSGKVHEFVQQNSKMIEGFKPFKKVRLNYREAILNEVTARQELKSPLGHLQIWKGRYEGSANWEGCVNEIKNIVGLFPELKEEVKEFVS